MKKEKQVDTAVIISAIEKDAKPHERKLQKITSIQTQADFDLVAENLKTIKSYGKIAVEKRQDIVNPILRAVEKINLLFLPFLTRIAELEVRYKQMMLDYENKKSKQAEKLTSQLQSGKIKKLGTYTRKIDALSVKSEHSSTRTIWKAEVVDVKKLPREYMVPDMKAIAKDLKAGKEIPGAVLKENKIIAI